MNYSTLNGSRHNTAIVQDSAAPPRQNNPKQQTYNVNTSSQQAIRMLSKPVRSSYSGNQRRHSAYGLSDGEMYSSQVSLVISDPQINSECDTISKRPLSYNGTLPLHNKFSASQPALNLVDERNLQTRGASRNLAELSSQLSSRAVNVAYPNLMKHSLEDLLKEPRPIPVKIPTVPTKSNASHQKSVNHTCTSVPLNVAADSDGHVMHSVKQSLVQTIKPIPVETPVLPNDDISNRGDFSFVYHTCRTRMPIPVQVPTVPLRTLHNTSPSHKQLKPGVVSTFNNTAQIQGNAYGIVPNQTQAEPKQENNNHNDTIHHEPCPLQQPGSVPVHPTNNLSSTKQSTQSLQAQQASLITPLSNQFTREHIIQEFTHKPVQRSGTENSSSQNMSPNPFASVPIPVPTPTVPSLPGTQANSGTRCPSVDTVASNAVFSTSSNAALQQNTDWDHNRLNIVKKSAHSMPAPIPVGIPLVPRSKSISVCNPTDSHTTTSAHALSTLPQRSRGNHAVSNTSELPAVNNIPRITVESTMSQQPVTNDTYRERSQSYSGNVKPFQPYRLRSTSLVDYSSYKLPKLKSSHSHLDSPECQHVCTNASLIAEEVTELSSSSDDDQEPEDAPSSSFTIKSPGPAEISDKLVPTTVSFNVHLSPGFTEQQAKSVPTSLPSFVSANELLLPKRVRITKGTLYPSGGVAISSGHDLDLHFVKHAKVATVKDTNGNQYLLPYNSSVKVSVLYNPTNPSKVVPKGFSFRSAGDIMKLRNIPLVIAATKSFEGTSHKSSVKERQVLIVRGIKTDSNVGYQLMVKTLTGHRKLLPQDCVAQFSTNPNLIALTVREMVENKIKLPQKVVLQYPSSIRPDKSLPSIVTVTTYSTVTSVVATHSLLGENPVQPKVLEIPMLSDLMVKELDETTSESLKLTQNLYKSFDACTTLHCSDSPRTAVHNVQSILFKSLSTNHRSFGLELVCPDSLKSKQNIPNPLLALPSALMEQEPPHTLPYGHSPDSYSSVHCSQNPSSSLSQHGAMKLCTSAQHDTNPPLQTDIASQAQLSATDTNTSHFSEVVSADDNFSTKLTHGRSKSESRLSDDRRVTLPTPSDLGNISPVHTSSGIQLKNVNNSAQPVLLTESAEQSLKGSFNSTNSISNGSESHVHELVQHIRSLEAKCSNTDEQLTIVTRQYNEVKSVLSSIQRSISSEFTGKPSSVQSKGGSNDYEVLVAEDHTTESNVSEIANKSECTNTQPENSPNQKQRRSRRINVDVEPSAKEQPGQLCQVATDDNADLVNDMPSKKTSENSDKELVRHNKRGYFGRTRARLQKLLKRKQPASPDQPQSLHHSKGNLNSIPEVTETMEDIPVTDTIMNSCSDQKPREGSSFREDVPVSPVQQSKKPPLLPKPALLKKKDKVDSLKTTSTSFLNQNNSALRNEEVTATTSRTAITNRKTEHSQAVAKEPYSGSTNSRQNLISRASLHKSEVDTNLKRNVKAEKSSKNLTIAACQLSHRSKDSSSSASSTPKPISTAHTSKSLSNSSPSHSKASSRKQCSFGENPKPAISSTPDTRCVINSGHTDDTNRMSQTNELNNFPCEDNEDLDALVDDITIWCSQIEAEVNQLSQVGLSLN